MIAHQAPRGALHHADALAVVAALPVESVRLVYCDGPYGLGFGEWDTAVGSALVDWYAPHFDAWDRVLLPSASLVVWGVTRSWAYLHVELERRGWEQAGQIVWDKGYSGTSMRFDPNMLRSWPQTHEIAGIYRRDALGAPTCAASSIQHAAGGDDRNWIRLWLVSEWRDAGLKMRQANEACGVASMAGHYFGASQWHLPTWEKYQDLANYAAKHGAALPPERNARPWLVHPAGGDLRASFEPLRASFEPLRASFEHLRASFEHLRAPFDLATIAPSVWRESSPTHGAARHGHPNQKPDSITRRLIEVLTRPGELVLEPFGGSSPVARACEAMPDSVARRWLSCETDATHVAQTVAMLRHTQPRLL